MSYGYGNYPPQGGPPPPGGGYPPQQPQGYGGYPPQGGSYPPQGGAYPPQPGAYPSQPGMYPPSSGPAAAAPYPGAAPGYPPSSAPAPGYPPAGGAAPGYPPAPSGYPPSSGGLGFEGVASGPRQPPAQNYGAPPPPGPGAGYYPPAAGGYQQQPAGGYQQQPAGYPPQQQYGAPPPSAPTYQPPYGAPGPYPASPHYPPAHLKTSTKQLSAGMAAMSIKTHGTVKPASPFNAEEDAKVLRKAMKGIGTDEKAIINIIGYRTNKQRQEIITAYKQMFGKDLIKDLKSELSGNFESLVKALMMKPTHYDLYCLERAMSGIGTNEATLIEILATRSNAEIREIKELYKKDKRKDLEKELRSETSGHFARLLVSLANAARNESTTVDMAKAQADAQALYQAGEKKWGTDESTFNMIMCSRSHAQLRATFDAYHKIANRDIIRSVEGEFSGDIESGLKAVVETARYAPAYFATRLHKSMAGGGTDDHALIRSVVTRSEIDMVEIKQEYQKKFGKSLASTIKGDTSGDYRSLLLAIVGQ